MKFKGFSIFLALVLAIAVSGLSTHTAYAADSDIIVSEVQFNAWCASNAETNPACDGSGTSELAYEWVEIYNKGTANVDIQNWEICDSVSCDTITASSLVIEPGQYWVIGNYSAGTQAEVVTDGDAFIAGRTISLGTQAVPNSIGSNGLSNTNDAIILHNSSGLVEDCVSWANPAWTTCSALTYDTGGTGTDTTLNNEGQGQTITNVQGVWDYTGAVAGTAQQATPYDENVLSDGTTTAITLHSMSAKSTPLAFPAILMVTTAGSLLFVLRRRK